MTTGPIDQRDCLEENAARNGERDCVEEKVVVTQNGDVLVDVPLRGDPLASPSHEWSITSSTECVDASFLHTLERLSSFPFASFVLVLVYVSLTYITSLRGV